MNSISCLWSLLFISLAAPSAAQAQGALEAWVQRYDGPGNGQDTAYALAVDTNGNVYVTGSTYGGDPLSGGSGMDCTTIAYSTLGLPLWTNYYNGPSNSQDEAVGIAVDPGGNVVVTGYSDPGTGPVVTTIKYSSSGALLWTNRQGPSGFGQIAALDGTGNVIVMGPMSGWSGGCLVIKYSSAGALLWARTYSGFTFVDGLPKTLAVDTNGDVLVAGSTAPIGGDYLTLKYSSAGALLWSRRYNGPGNGTDMASGVAVDAEGNVFVTGWAGVAGPTGSSSDYATLKYSSAGVPLWTNRYNGPLNDNDQAHAIATDSEGNVVVTGWSAGAIGQLDCATIKYSNFGVPLWTNRCVGGGDRAALAVDSNGNVYVTGPAADYLTFAYSSTGVPLWTNRYNGPGNYSDWPTAIVVDASANVYVTGFSTGSGSGDDWTRTDWATVKYVTPPIITRQPLSCTNAVGTTANFTVEAVGSLPLRYQWRQDGTNLLDGGNLSGVTTTNLLLTNVHLADACDYTVVVTNNYGSATSHVAHLKTTVPPSGGRFSNLAYSPQTGLSFIFRDGTVGQPYRIQMSSATHDDSWVDWMNFTYLGPTAFTDLGAAETERRYYRAVSP